MLWLIVVPAASTAFGLLAAQLTDRIAWGNIAKSLIFMPMAISFVGASVIFKLVYDTRPANQDQIGVLNAVWLAFDGGAPSFIFLRLVPALILLAFAAFMAYGIYLGAAPADLGRSAPWGRVLVDGAAARRRGPWRRLAPVAVAQVDLLRPHGDAALWRAADTG